MNFCATVLLALALVVSASAETCTPGYYKLKHGACRKCPKGTFQAKANRYACRPCPPGKIAAKEGSTKCTACPKGEEPTQFKNRCKCKKGTVKQGKKCKVCGPGSRAGDGYCEDCFEGYFQPKAGQTECLKCPKGSFSVYKATECVTCKEGEDFAITTGECARCKAGHTFDKYSGCRKCDRNKFKPKPGNGPCLPCPIGTHSRSGALKCVGCPKGTVLFKNRKCGKCKAGHFFVSYQKKCKKCGNHEFTPHENVKTKCYTCSSKKFALKGATKCITCPKHQFLMKDGSCGPCPKGSVYDRYSLKCNKCNFNEFTRGDMDYCESCQSGSYAFRGSTTCFTCPKNEALVLKKKGCATCPAGTYYESYSVKCSECYDDSIQPEPGIIETCESCPSGTTSNKDHTKCVPRKH